MHAALDSRLRGNDSAFAFVDARPTAGHDARRRCSALPPFQGRVPSIEDARRVGSDASREVSADPTPIASRSTLP